jgi:hypothetical protein
MSNNNKNDIQVGDIVVSRFSIDNNGKYLPYCKPYLVLNLYNKPYSLYDDDDDYDDDDSAFNRVDLFDLVNNTRHNNLYLSCYTKTTT